MTNRELTHYDVTVAMMTVMATVNWSAQLFAGTFVLYDEFDQLPVRGLRLVLWYPAAAWA
jgi:hypothetical protein